MKPLCQLRAKPPKIHDRPLVLAEQIVEGISTYFDEQVSQTVREVPVLVGVAPMVHKQVLRTEYRHVPLRWMSPGPDGKLIPR